MPFAVPLRLFRPLAGLLFCLFLSGLHCPDARAMGSAPQRYAVGMRTFGVWQPESGERLDIAVWYPSRVHGDESVLEGWIVEVGKRGRIEEERFPVVLLSHDTASGRFANNDMAASLASGGMVVIAPTHTGDSQISGSAMYSADLLRDRPRQLLRALETVLASPDFAPHIDESRIGLVGVGFGSLSVLQLAGAQPDFQPLRGYCPDAPEDDAFCAPWSANRLAHLPKAMQALTARQGAGVFTPPLSLYAPRLVRVAVPPEQLCPLPRNVEEPKRSFWQRLFASEKDKEEAAPPPPAQNATLAEEKPSDAEAGETANFPLLLDFQGGPKFGGTDSGAPFVHIALSDSPQYRVPVPGGTGNTPAKPESAADKNDGPRVYRREAETRRILGLALVAPAGGMLFSREALASVRIPVAVVEAGKDSLYPPFRHAHPYGAKLPSLPLTLSLDNADHFSLFARCSRDTQRTLGEICGRLGPDERRETAEKRDLFLTPFFQSVLGGPLPPAEPSGLVAAPGEP